MLFHELFFNFLSLVLPLFLFLGCGRFPLRPSVLLRLLEPFSGPGMSLGLFCFVDEGVFFDFPLAVVLPVLSPSVRRTFPEALVFPVLFLGPVTGDPIVSLRGGTDGIVSRAMSAILVRVDCFTFF